ncbi:MAG: Hpt domain-containing protein [Hyphomicrobiales bacterium]
MKILNKSQFDKNFSFFDTKTKKEIIELFKVEYQSKIEVIDTSLIQKDFDDLIFSFHSLKGVIGNFELGAPYKKAKELELLSKENNYTSIVEKLPLFKEDIKLLIEDLEEIKKTL